jgi:hypothetical protein
MTTALVQLSGQENWDLERLTASSFSWPITKGRTVQLRDVATVVPTNSWVESGSPVVVPTGLDAATGSIRRRSRKYRGAAYQIGTGESGVMPGDLLVPQMPNKPALLVGDRLLGSAASSKFLAIRTERSATLWVWAVLNSRHGNAFRQSFSSGTVTYSIARGQLLDLVIPWPTLAQMAQHEIRLREIEGQTHIPEEEAGGSWWHTVDLRTTEWNLALATSDLELLDHGTPLAALCTDIIRGRAPHGGFDHEPLPGSLPVTDINVISGNPARRWTSANVANQVIARSNDVFVAAIGARPNAALATGISAVNPNLYLLRLVDPALAPGLVAFLNGPTGYGLRKIFLTGTGVPHLAKDALVRLPIPDEILEPSGDSTLLSPLADRLESVLWN